MLLEQLILDDEADLWYQNDKIDGKLICRKKNNRHRINIDGNNKVKIEFCFRKLHFHSIEMDCYAGLQRRCGYN